MSHKCCQCNGSWHKVPLHDCLRGVLKAYKANVLLRELFHLSFSDQFIDDVLGDLHSLVFCHAVLLSLKLCDTDISLAVQLFLSDI